MKITIATVFLTLLIAATISALSIVSYRAVTRDSAPTPQPDRVVAVLAKCQRFAYGQVIDQSGSECLQGGTFNSRLHITVRKGNGSTYEIDVPTSTTTDVTVGDTWP